MTNEINKSPITSGIKRASDVATTVLANCIGFIFKKPIQEGIYDALHNVNPNQKHR